MIVETNKMDAVNLSWLQLATCKEADKLILTAVANFKDKSEAADGYRLHSMKRPIAALPKPEGDKPTLTYIEGKVRKSPRIYRGEEIEGNWVDTDKVQPRGLPMAIVSVDKEYLFDAAQMPGGDVLKITVYEGNPLRIENELCEALIMPVNVPDEQATAAARRARVGQWLEENEPEKFEKILKGEM